LYLDEIIDVRVIEEAGEEVPKKAVICSNNELLKVVDLETGSVIQSSGGHEDIILCVDACNNYFLSGSKDNSIRLWTFANNTLSCLGAFTGHNENVASVCFAPKKLNFFVSASQDNTLKVWDMSYFKTLEEPPSEPL
jgi:U3 small nucleolar RNA-associated protein 13